MTRSPSATSRLAALVTAISIVSLTGATTWAQGPAPATPPSGELGQEYVVTLRLGEPAPFAGTLFNVPAAARLAVDLRLRSAECQVETDRQLRLLEAELRLEIDTQVARREALQHRHDQMMAIRDERIDFLTSQLEPPRWYQRGPFRFMVGLVAGVALTVLSAYTISLVSR
jgi:hypothetical protein